MLSIATGHSIRYFTDAVAKGRESYYTGAVAAGEPPGRWYGAGAAALGLEGEVDADLMEAVYTRLLDPRDPAAHSRDTWDEAAPLAAGHRKYRSADEVYDALLEANPGAGPEQRAELRAQAERSAEQAVSFIDVTYSAPKSVTVLAVAFERAEMEGVRPFVDVDHAQYRLITAAEALVAVDHREDLLKMDPYDFERLVKQLFTAMGYTTWRTRSWGDDGIDAVATKEDDVFPFECVIQAKRFHKAVPPRDVQSLMGAMAEHSTATHGVLVTTSWLSDRSRQRARAQRIVTFEGSNLVCLIEKHLHRKVVISTKPPKRRT